MTHLQTENHHPKVFGRRKARPLKEQTQELYDNLLPSIRFNPDSFNWDTQNKLVLEIGFGGGEHLAFQALQNPNTHFIGAEPFINGIASLLKLIEEYNINNISIWDDDVHLLLDKAPKKEVFDRAYLLFADPWPKKRHHNRRFIQKDNIKRIHELLKPGGHWYIATDHVTYREWILEHLNASDALFTQERSDIYARPPEAQWPKTRYEEKGAREGRHSAYMTYKKIN
ncbi:MAG: tRNA (guanosine(46)-N7)-methyltransferase TrmB [Alphaproteobacteria bacterium CG_4_10_14_0_8_um_filter_37_21]|nr:MAG: tRNA (guanosine(46)-N7)-methyltransferase TrmB [Alphaproteobacteria bacterium CG_4_10_14_0_8_um_filter_37_21]